MLYSIFFIILMFTVVFSNIGKFLKTKKLNEEQIIAVIIALPFVVTFLWILLTFK